MTDTPTPNAIAPELGAYLAPILERWRVAKAEADEAVERADALSREVKELSWRAQHRLNRRFLKLTFRGVHYNKVVVAIARELAAFIWELARLVEREEAAKPRVA